MGVMEKAKRNRQYAKKWTLLLRPIVPAPVLVQRSLVEARDITSKDHANDHDKTRTHTGGGAGGN